MYSLGYLMVISVFQCYSYADKYVLCCFAENRSQGYEYNPWTDKF